MIPSSQATCCSMNLHLSNYVTSPAFPSHVDISAVMRNERDVLTGTCTPVTGIQPPAGILVMAACLSSMEASRFGVHHAVTCCCHMLLSHGAVTWCCHMLLSHAAVTCCCHMLLSHAAVTCCCHMLLSHAAVTCCCHMLLSHAAVTCSCHMLLSHVLLSHAAVTCCCHMLLSHAAVTCCCHMLLSHAAVTCCCHNCNTLDSTALTLADIGCCRGPAGHPVAEACSSSALPLRTWWKRPSGFRLPCEH